jgi:hypothetical protein
MVVGRHLEKCWQRVDEVFEMDNERKINILKHLVFDLSGCTECIHKVYRCKDNNVYPDCELRGCENGKYFDINPDEYDY